MKSNRLTNDYDTTEYGLLDADTWNEFKSIAAATQRADADAARHASIRSDLAEIKTEVRKLTLVKKGRA